MNRAVDRNDVIAVPVAEENGRPRPGCSREALRARPVLKNEQAGQADDRGQRLRPAQTDMERHHGALAEADQRQPPRLEIVGTELRIDQRVQAGAGLRYAAPALMRVPHGQREPLSAGRPRMGQAVGRVRGEERRIRQPLLPCPAELDQVVPVGAIAMKQKHELLRLSSGGRREARAWCGCHRLRLSTPPRCGSTCPRASGRSRD
jgi:hypothetical protein